MVGVLRRWKSSAWVEEFEIPSYRNLCIGQEIELPSGELFVVEYTGRYYLDKSGIQRLDDFVGEEEFFNVR